MNLSRRRAVFVVAISFLSLAAGVYGAGRYALRDPLRGTVHWVRCASCDVLMISEPDSAPTRCGSCDSPLLFAEPIPTVTAE